MKRRLFSLFFALVLLCAMAVSAAAHEVPNPDEPGSITISMLCEGEPVPGGELTLYKVGDVAEDDGNYSFAPAADFAGSNPDFTDITSADLAQKLADYAKSEKIQSDDAQTAADDGNVKFTNLPNGLYLVVQTKTAQDYEPIKPFLVSIPFYDAEKETYLYDVNASSKMSTITPPPETTTPPPPPGGGLPQTGQLNWPVPVLAVGGLALVAIGWMLRSGRKKEENAQ